MAISLPLLCVLILTLVQPLLGASNNFNYNVSDTKYGPYGWPKTFPDFCNGSSQSPINIETSKTTHASLGQLTLTKFDTVPTGAKFKVTNNGHSYSVFLAPNTFSVSEGGLTGEFTTVQFHFHWGSDNNKGSEHTVDGKKYPAEMHFVSFNKKYSEINEALEHDDGLAVLGVIFEVGATENKALTSFLKYALNVTKPSEMTGLSMNHSLGSLLPLNTTDFYRYKGSLTTPRCNEVVTWTVFKNYATISANQLAMLRSLKDNATIALTDTFRPVQPLNSRVVQRSFKTAADDKEPDNESCLVTVTMTTILSALVVAVLLI
ncbi:carbonic anhydrase 2-like [Actinia tenebrosa]|uniref:Carbonic anhydrase n=1 Tax=Actinia tenebrosa TaxID=6105 RepID=A0A6P8HPC0_ACTTE|nr:carbonic anhydrase 2-like [Actinia tenebrosa]XP_031556904.1 carbonic anhydrase 2-like [Actinia tenebrosa]XP_031556905.1 carbonic anhydrase 2-like [Actinia tenebrosa]